MKVKRDNGNNPVYVGYEGEKIFASELFPLANVTIIEKTIPAEKI